AAAMLPALAGFTPGSAPFKDSLQSTPPGFFRTLLYCGVLHSSDRIFALKPQKNVMAQQSPSEHYSMLSFDFHIG
ncbi:hypothetical protein P7M35_25090, partial [Vibrio parahaemolyticus]|nr:hypothetical protein [Vibrio parahaemolyticus]